VPDLEVKVVPRAARDAVGPVVDGVLHVRVTRPPSDGEANRAMIGLVAGALGVAPSRVELIAGRRAHRKRLRVSGLADAELASRLRSLGAD
jgi:uncharacterized protein